MSGAGGGSSPIFVDARQLERPPTGVAIWLRSVLREWIAAESGPRLMLLTRGPVDGFDTRPISAPSFWWHIAAAWRARRARGRYLSPDSFIVPILLGRRAVLVVHDLTPVLLPRAHTRRSRLSHRVLLRLALRRTGTVVVPSDATRLDVVALEPSCADRLVVVPEAARELPPPDSETVCPRPAVLYVGTIEPRKNVAALVRAFRHVAPASWSLVLAGKRGWLSPEEVVELDRAIDGDERIRELGYVSDAALSALYGSADIFVYPSSYEGFGLPVLEAMSRGVVTVTTDAAALREVAGDGAALVPVEGLETALESVLAELIADPAARAALGEAGRARASAFSWRVTAADLMAVLARPW